MLVLCSQVGIQVDEKIKHKYEFSSVRSLCYMSYEGKYGKHTTYRLHDKNFPSWRRQIERAGSQPPLARPEYADTLSWAG